MAAPKTEQPVQDVGRRMARGAAWMMTMGLSVRLLGLVSTMFLARLLVPSDFGLITLAASIYGMLEILGAFNFEMALIQNQQAERRHYDTAWTLNVLYGLFTAVGLLALAIPAGRFFGDDRLAGVMCVFAASAAIGGFKNIGVVAFQKELNFSREFAFVLLSKVVSVVVTVSLAFALRTYWALATGILVSSIFGLGISYAMHPYRPWFALSAWRELMRFSGWMLFSNIIIFTGNRGYDLIIGRMAGTQSLGLYSVAYELANLPTTEIVWPATKAIFPGFSRIAHDRGQLKEMFLRTAGLVALITIPAGAGVAVLAEPLVRLMLGTNWLAAVPLIQILAVFGMVRAMQAGVGSVYLALGMTRLIAWVATPHLLVGLPLAGYLLAAHGLVWATIGVLVSGIIALAVSFVFVLRALSLGVAELAACYWRPLIAMALMVLAVYALLPGGGTETVTVSYVAWTFMLVALGAVTYAAAVSVLWFMAGRPAGAESLTLDWLRGRWNRPQGPE